jgi:hypothetical protein
MYPVVVEANRELQIQGRLLCVVAVAHCLLSALSSTRKC